MKDMCTYTDSEGTICTRPSQTKFLLRIFQHEKESGALNKKNYKGGKKKRRVTGHSPALIQVLQKEELTTGTEVEWLLQARPKKGKTWWKKKEHPVRASERVSELRTGQEPGRADVKPLQVLEGLWKEEWHVANYYWLLWQVWGRWRGEGLRADQKVLWERPDAPSCSGHLSFLTGRQRAGAAQRERSWKTSGGGKIINNNGLGPCSWSTFFNMYYKNRISDW